MRNQAALSHDAGMRLAVEHANLVKGGTYPNPPVGAVILDRDSTGRRHGRHQTGGSGSAAGGTAVVTLEPCNHYDKTPPLR